MANTLQHKIGADIAPFLSGPLPEPLSDDCDLIGLGLDSLAMMKLAAMWRRQGHDVSFARLIARPRLDAWVAMLAAPPKTPAPSQPNHCQPQDDSAPFPLALMQHAYWVGRDSAQHLGGVAAHFYYEFDIDQPDVERLEGAIRQLFARHGMLRVQVLDDGRQRILPQSGWPGLHQYDLRQHDAHGAARELEAIREALSHRQLDIAAGEVFDVRLSHKPTALGGGGRLHFNLDMIAADAMSLRVLLDDLAALYLAPQSTLSPQGISYPRYQQLRAAWLSEPDQQATVQADRAWWLARLADLPGAPLLPVAAAQGQNSQRVVRRHRTFSAVERSRLAECARQHQLTLPMMIAAAFAEILTQFSDEEDFILNLPLFNRDMLHPDVPALVGDFTSSILLAWCGSAPGDFAERAHRLQRQFREDAAHARFSGVEVLREASRLRGQQQYAPVVFTSALGLGELFSERVQRAFGKPGWIVSQGPQVWLDAQVTELEQGILINWDAREATFPAGMLDLMFERFIGLLERLTRDEACWFKPVESVLPAAQHQVRQRANATDAPVPQRCLHDDFFRLAERHPDAPALFYEQGSLRYGELADRALRLAAYLRLQGVTPGEPVAISLPKGPEQIIAVLAVLACGGVWLPLNHRQPAARTETILRDAGVTQIITSVTFGQPLPPAIRPFQGDNRRLAYIIYTSGSTGTPKGVEISHLAAKNTIDDLNRRYGSGSALRTLAVSALSFDLAVYDIFAPLSVGGAVVCIDDDSWRDAQRWVALIRRYRVTTLNCVPAIAEMTVTSAAADGLPLPLVYVLLGGDWVPLDLADKLRAVAPDCRCIALGGTTETAIHSTVQEITTVPAAWRSVPYGFPLDNVRCRVVDSQGRDRCDGVSGELWIGGAGVALGYRHDPERTADRFVTHAGERWYRTGDLARYHPDGSLEFLGRRDHQLKIRGYRIEPGEIAAALNRWPEVERSVVLLDSQRRLTAVVTPRGQRIDLPALRAHLREQLPQEMLPERLEIATDFPLSSNGKIDRDALRQRLSESAALPQTQTKPAQPGVEQQVAALWQTLLGQLPGREDDFFALGGDSLLATRTIAGLRQAGYPDVTLSQLFSQPRLADFCRTLHSRRAAHVPPALTHDAAGRYQPFPLTDVQQAYLFGREQGFALGGIGCTFYREFEVPGLDADRLEAAVNALILRHDMLRAVFSDGQQRVLERVPVYRLMRFQAADADNIDRQRAALSAHSFDPAHWPLFSVSVAQQGDVRRVAIAIDNLILDALSILQFYQELAALYQQQPLHAPAAIQFRDALLASRASDTAREAAWAWWQPRLATLPLAPQLPLAVNPQDLTPPRFTRREYRLDAAAWRQLTQKARQQGVTPSAVMLSAFASVLRRWCQQPAFTLNLTLFDRPENHADIRQVLGDFTSLVLVPCRPSADGWLDEVRQVQREMWGALDHRALSAVSVLRALAREHQQPELVMPVVFTSALGLREEASAGIFSQPVYGLSQTPQVWLDHQVTENEGGISLVWDAVDALFPAGMLDAMFSAYQQRIADLCQRPWTQPLPDLLPADQRQVREAITLAAQSPWPPQTLHQGFFHHAAQRPGDVALIWEEGDVPRQLTYGELAEQALRLGRWLRRQGALPGDRVAVSLAKGPQQVIAVLGILAAGGSWVPIGVEQPALRREAIIRRAGVRLRLDAATPLFGPDAVQATTPPLARPQEIDPRQLAYIIFTSGSTGEPKGVEMSHAAADNTLRDLRQRLEMQPRDRVLALSGLDFDLSLFDLFAPLACGAALVMVDERHRRDAAHWLGLIQRHQVTLWNAVPALLEMLLIAARDTPLPTLRAALVSGDWIALSLPGRLAQLAPGCRFLALGGATEAAIWSNIWPVDGIDPAWRAIPYGYPLRNQRWQVLNPAGEVCPDWVDGELLIGGAGLALGYLDDPQLTAERFIQHEGQRWYRTGDRGRYHPNGSLEFLGRMDTQMKLRGHRIEAGEVEQALLTLPDISHAAASLWHDGTTLRLMAAVAPALAATGESEGEFIPDHAQRHSLEAESAVAERILIELLRLPEQVGERWTMQALQPDERGRQVLALWLTWLQSRGLLSAADEGAFTATASLAAMAFAPPHPSPLLPEARSRYGSWRAMLRGEQREESLLSDGIFAPASLSAADPQTQRWLAQLTGRITELYRERGEPVRLIDLNGASGQHAAELLAHLPPQAVRYMLLEPSPLALEQARSRLRACGHEVELLRHDGLLLPAALSGCADIVFAANGLHRYSLPEEGFSIARQLLKTRGELWLLERQSLTPLAMLSAGLLAGGYGSDGQHPLRSGAVWQQRALRAGFTDIALDDRALAAQLTMSNPRTLGLVPEWRALLAERLPQAMIPDCVVLLSHMPLTANGKVDRKRLQSLYAHLPEAERQQEALEPLEAQLALLWAELLSLSSPVGLHQGFFELGGDSLLATRLINAIRDTFAVEMPLRQIFSSPDLQAMAAAIAARQAEDAAMEGGAL